MIFYFNQNPKGGPLGFPMEPHKTENEGTKLGKKDAGRPLIFYFNQNPKGGPLGFPMEPHKTENEGTK